MGVASADAVSRICRLFSRSGPPPCQRAAFGDRAGRSRPRYPLDVALCPACALVQLVETAGSWPCSSPTTRNLSSFSRHDASACRRMPSASSRAGRSARTHSWWRSAVTTAICCGTSRQAGVAVLGIDPARAAAAAAERVGVPTRTAFFGRRPRVPARRRGHPCRRQSSPIT